AHDIVDAMDGESVANRAAALESLADRFFRDLAQGHSSHPVCAATVDTALRWGIPAEHFHAFIESMTMDLSVDHYDTFDDLYTYVYGSAAVIGLQMVPILEPSSDEAYGYAKDLGVAFQLANFIRDVSEDLDRGRIYLPLEVLANFGVTPKDLYKRQMSDDLRSALAFQVDRVRELEERSRPGIALLSPPARPCIETARILYCGIADEVAKNNYDVFSQRARVPLRTRLAVALPAWQQARRARRRRALNA
ncbi:MAG: phytoene/squalene synthase family protein, partial [Candidatus Nanopelagicales bacterium]